MNDLRLVVSALDALEWAACGGLVRVSADTWRPSKMENISMVTVGSVAVDKLLELKLIYVTSSSAGVPCKVKTTKAGRDLLGGYAS